MMKYITVKLTEYQYDLVLDIMLQAIYNDNRRETRKFKERLHDTLLKATGRKAETV